jgi:hypothetical protein
MPVMTARPAIAISLFPVLPSVVPIIVLRICGGGSEL